MALILHDLVLCRLLFELASDYRKTNKGWCCVEKVAETKFSREYIKNNLQQLKKWCAYNLIVVATANCDS